MGSLIEGLTFVEREREKRESKKRKRNGVRVLAHTTAGSISNNLEQKLRV